MTPRTTEENEKIRRKRREGILEAALKLFAVQGYHKTTVSDIARSAGISKGSVYSYFSNKEELLKEVIVHNYKDTSDELFEIFQENYRKMSRGELLELIVDKFFTMMKEQASMWKLSVSLSMQTSDMPEIQQLMKKIFDDAVQRISMLLSFDEEAENQARIIAASMDGIALHYYVVGEEYDLEGVKNVFVNNLKNKIK